jgi:hypothetical protein
MYFSFAFASRLLLFRALRPDRLTSAMTKFVSSMLGQKFVTSQPYDLERSFQDSSAGVPIFVFLSPGVDVAGSVEALGRKLGYTADAGGFNFLLTSHLASVLNLDAYFHGSTSFRSEAGGMVRAVPGKCLIGQINSKVNGGWGLSWQAPHWPSK